MTPTEPAEYELASFLITVRGPAPDPDFAPERFDDLCDGVKELFEGKLTLALESVSGYSYTLDGDDL